jgi:hypothetical protein
MKNLNVYSEQVSAKYGLYTRFVKGTKISDADKEVLLKTLRDCKEESALAHKKVIKHVKGEINKLEELKKRDSKIFFNNPRKEDKPVEPLHFLYPGLLAANRRL